MRDVSRQIAAILEERRSRLPAVDAEAEQWRRLDDAIVHLDSVVREVRDHQHTPSDLKAGLAGFQVEELRKGIASALDLLSVLQARYARGTVNIGVSGRARVGKSTLLQSISGLSDSQIPTGSGLPVTAVRSRIFHSVSHKRATLALHSFATFRDEVLRPYHMELGLTDVPSSVDQFRTWHYPASETDLPPEYRDRHSSLSMLRRLRDMQKALWSFEKHLTGGDRLVDLGELREFVAYPTNEAEEHSERCPRPYLAVRDVKIECSFPFAQVEDLGIIDLPGLGELAPNAERYHLAGLQNEVDLVLLVKRPVEGMAYWGREDGCTTNLLDDARGFITERRDFVFVVLNSGGANTELATALRDDVRRQANDGVDGKHFKVLEGDASSQVSVFESILAPVLEHLAERLPVMDREVVNGTRASYATVIQQVGNALSDLEDALGGVRRAVGSSAEDVERRTVELRKDLAGALAELVDEFQAQARAGEEDPGFLEAVDVAYGSIREWIRNGFGRGEDEWCVDALRTMRVDRNSSPFTANELNRIRVEISRRYGSLDNYFGGRVDALCDRVAGVLANNLGGLLAGRQGRTSLEGLATMLVEASEPCTELGGAVDDLLALRLEYRTHLHPRVRRALDGLNLQITDPESGEQKDQIVVEVSEAGAEQLFHVVRQLAEQAAYHTKKALIHEAMTPALVLHAAAEQFEDSLIRSGASEREFRRLARSYRDEIWPGVYQGLDEANARFAKVVRSVTSVRGLLNSMAGED